MRKNGSRSASYGGEICWGGKGDPISSCYSDVLSSFTASTSIFQRWIAECVYERLSKPKDNGLDY